MGVRTYASRWGTSPTGSSQEQYFVLDKPVSLGIISQ